MSKISVWRFMIRTPSALVLSAAQGQRHTRVPQVGLHNRREIKRECKGLKLVGTAVFGVGIHGLNAGAAS